MSDKLILSNHGQKPTIYAIIPLTTIKVRVAV